MSLSAEELTALLVQFAIDRERAVSTSPASDATLPVALPYLSAMIRNPLGPQDSRWLLLRVVALGIVLCVHPLPFDLRRWGLAVPAHASQTAYVVFECLQTVVFAAAIFFGDMIPGMRWVAAYYRRLIAEMRAAPLAVKFVRPLPFLLGATLAAWFILTPVESIVKAVPPGSPRFVAATAYFIIERVVAISVFIIIVTADDDDDDDPGARRRSIAENLAKLLRPRRARTRVPVTTS